MIDVLIEKAKTKIKNVLTMEDRIKHIAWLSAAFGRNLMFYNNTVRHPEDFIEGASRRYACMVIGDFKELLKVDKFAAKMIYDTHSHDLWNMVREALDQDPSEYFKFYYKAVYGNE